MKCTQAGSFVACIRRIRQQEFNALLKRSVRRGPNLLAIRVTRHHHQLIECLLCGGKHSGPWRGVLLAFHFVEGNLKHDIGVLHDLAVVFQSVAIRGELAWIEIVERRIVVGFSVDQYDRPLDQTEITNGVIGRSGAQPGPRSCLAGYSAGLLQ